MPDNRSYPTFEQWWEANDDGSVDRDSARAGWEAGQKAHPFDFMTRPAPPETGPDFRVYDDEGLVSTRRMHDGVVHEMADFGTDALCDRALPEPWEWTDAPVNCPECRVRGN